MRLKKFLIEMAIEDALKVLGLTSDDLGDEQKLKRAYRRASLENHPDKGGSKELMQDVNDAYNSLKGTKAKPRRDYEAEEKKEWQLAVAVKTALLSTFKPEVFINFFNDLSNHKFKHNFISQWPKTEKFERYGNYGTIGFKSEFFNKDRSIVFELDVLTFSHDIKSEGLLGYGTLSFPLTTNTYAFANNKRHKFGKQEWGSTRDHAFLNDPEKIFPVNKVKDILSGKSRKGSKFSKRDMHTFLVKKLQAEQPFTEKSQYIIPIGEEKYLKLHRDVLMRIPGWTVHGVYQKKGRWQYIPVENMNFKLVTLPESEDTAKEFEILVKSLKRKSKDDNAIKKLMTTWIDKKRKEKGY